MSRIYVDADACPVKEEVYRVAERHGLPVTLVANSWMRTPPVDWVVLVVVSDGFDAADDWIVSHAGPEDIVVTGDILLAERCVKNQVLTLGHGGKAFTEASIGGAVATREFLSQMREHSLIRSGPAPFEKKDRSRFLQALDEMARAVRRRQGG